MWVWYAHDVLHYYVQESTLFFTALDKVVAYFKMSGVLPTLVSENVKGITFRRWDAAKVR